MNDEPIWIPLGEGALRAFTTGAAIALVLVLGLVFAGERVPDALSDMALLGLVAGTVAAPAALIEARVEHAGLETAFATALASLFWLAAVALQLVYAQGVFVTGSLQGGLERVLRALDGKSASAETVVVAIVALAIPAAPLVVARLRARSLGRQVATVTAISGVLSSPFVGLLEAPHVWERVLAGGVTLAVYALMPGAAWLADVLAREIVRRRSPGHPRATRPIPAGRAGLALPAVLLLLVFASSAVVRRLEERPAIHLRHLFRVGKSINAVGFARLDAATVLLSGGDAGRVIATSIPGLETLHELDAREGAIEALVVAPPDDLFATCGEGHVSIWSVPSWQRAWVSPSWDGRKPIALARDMHVAVGGPAMRDATIHVEKSGRTEGSIAFPGGPPSALAFSPDGTLLAASSSTDGGLRIFDVATRALAWSIAGWPGTRGRAVAFSPSGDVVALATDRGKLGLWSTVSHELAHELEVPGQDLRALAFAPTGAVVAASAGDEVHLWRVSDGRELRALVPGERVNALAFSPAGDLAVGADNGFLWLYPEPLVPRE